MRRVGYEGWLRNMAVGLGNAGKNSAIVSGLKERYSERIKISPNDMVAEHIHWALLKQERGSE